MRFYLVKPACAGQGRRLTSRVHACASVRGVIIRVCGRSSSGEGHANGVTHRNNLLTIVEIDYFDLGLRIDSLHYLCLLIIDMHRASRTAPAFATCMRAIEMFRSSEAGISGEIPSWRPISQIGAAVQEWLPSRVAAFVSAIGSPAASLGNLLGIVI